MLQDDQDPVLRGRSRYIPQNRPSGGSIHSPDFLTLHGKVHRCASLRLEAVSRYKQIIPGHVPDQRTIETVYEFFCSWKITHGAEWIDVASDRVNDVIDPLLDNDGVCAGSWYFM